jgi:ABC-type Mn2+/Zn2+ transport system permease subunit
VIGEFVASWPLFHNTYLAGWAIAVLLGLVGVVVVARDQIFIGAAISQATILGLTVGMWLGQMTSLIGGSWYEPDALVVLVGSVFAVLGALVTANPGSTTNESREAITGWVFLLGIGGSVLLVAHSPHGLEEVHRLVVSTLIGATSLDVLIFATMAAATIAVFARWHDALLLLLMDPEMARAVGLRAIFWDRVLYVWLGFTVAFSLRVSGMVYTFGCLVLPALFARIVCREARMTFVAAPLVALGATVVAFVLAHHYDFPPAHLAVTLLVGLVGVAWLVRGMRG